ncbi:MAG TPA: hypothetical protein VKP30_21615 [Polyangiaceae bacterium]|nr:hypothetical protein [Polyangiaceae bacterium]
MRRHSLALPFVVLLVSGCHALFGGVKLAEVASAAEKPSNVALIVSVTQKEQPVIDLGPAAFSLREDDQPLDAEAVDLRLLDPATVAAFHTVLLVDLSHGNNDEHRRQLARAAATFVRRARQKQNVTVLAFDGSQRTRLVGDFPFESSGVGPDQLENLLFMPLGDPSRNLNGAVISAMNVLDRRLERSNRVVRVGTLVVFSRGPDVAGRVPNSDVDKRVSDTEHQLVYVDVAGDQSNDVTAALARGGAVESENAETLPIAFEEAAMRVNRLLGQYYLLSYCSPARAGERKLYVEVQVADADGKMDGDDFETKFDATGFSPNCNAGVPPRFTVVRHAGGHHSSKRTAPGAQGDVTVDAPATESEEDSEPEDEVPPPKNRGYAP